MSRSCQLDAQISFDAAKLSSSKVTLTVDMGSASIGTPEMDTELPKAPWFNVSKFPQASFASSSIKRLAYHVGDGEWADTSMVADDVQVRFKLSLSGVGKF